MGPRRFRMAGGLRRPYLLFAATPEIVTLIFRHVIPLKDRPGSAPGSAGPTLSFKSGFQVTD
jgi:hypothetical protein